MRNVQQSRQWRIFHILWHVKSGMTAASLCAALGDGSHPRTVRRDMEAIAAGFPAVRFEVYARKRILRIDRGRLLELLEDKPHVAKKVCVACKKPKSLSEFHNCRSYADGLWQECKECRNEYNRLFYAANYQKDRVTKRDASGKFVNTTGRRKRRKAIWQ